MVVRRLPIGHGIRFQEKKLGRGINVKDKAPALAAGTDQRPSIRLYRRLAECVPASAPGSRRACATIFSQVSGI